MTALLEITHACEFAAAHRLASPGLTDEQNRALYGPCAREHGHTYGLEVTVRGPVDPRTGMVVDLNVLARLVAERVIAHVDHRDLNRDVPFLEGCITTAENLVTAFWRELEPALRTFPGCRLHRLVLHEGRANRVEYRGDGDAPAPGR